MTKKKKTIVIPTKREILSDLHHLLEDEEMYLIQAKIALMKARMIVRKMKRENQNRKKSINIG